MSKLIERVEIITDIHRLRRYTAEEKVRLVEQTMQLGMTVSAVAFVVGALLPMATILGSLGRFGNSLTDIFGTSFGFGNPTVNLVFVHVVYGEDLSLRMQLPDRPDPMLVKTVGSLADGPIDDVRRLVDCLGHLERLGQAVTVYPDAEELIQSVAEPPCAEEYRDVRQNISDMADDKSPERAEHNADGNLNRPSGKEDADDLDDL